jgi:hypothetical protein
MDNEVKISGQWRVASGQLGRDKVPAGTAPVINLEQSLLKVIIGNYK